MNSPRIHFICFATKEYKKQAAKLAFQAKKVSLFHSISIYSPETLPGLSTLINQAANSRNLDYVSHREKLNAKHGYWIWKPFIILDLLDKINDGDILLYADSGCTLNVQNSQRLRLILELIRQVPNKNGVFFNLKRKISHYCSQQLLDKISQENNFISTGKNSPLATYFVLKASSQSKEFVNRWLDLCKQNNFELLSGMIDQHFPTHRHDQSILAALLASNNSFESNFIFLEDESYPLERKYYSFISATRSKSFLLALKIYLNKAKDLLF